MKTPKAYRLGEAEWARWDNFVEGVRSASLFQTAWWHEAWGVRPEIIVGLAGNESITAGIALRVTRFAGVRAIRRPAMTPVNGPVVQVPCDARPTTAASHIRQQLSILLAALPRVGLIDLAPYTELLDPAQFRWSGFDSMIGLTYVIPAGTVDWRVRMAPQRRSQLKRAGRELEEIGGTIEVAPPMADVIPLLVDTAAVKRYYRAMRPHLPRLDCWWQAVSQRNAGQLYGIRDTSGRLVCATILVWDARKAYYLGGGLHPRVRGGSHLNCLLFERMIDDALERGLAFDFEGSLVPGVERFFRGWGGAATPTYRFIKIPSPVVYGLWQAHRFFKAHRRVLAVGPS